MLLLQKGKRAARNGCARSSRCSAATSAVVAAVLVVVFVVELFVLLLLLLPRFASLRSCFNGARLLLSPHHCRRLLDCSPFAARSNLENRELSFARRSLVSFCSHRTRSLLLLVFLLLLLLLLLLRFFGALLLVRPAHFLCFSFSFWFWF